MPTQLCATRHTARWIGTTEKGMIATWKANLKHPEKYVCIDPKKLFKGIIEDDVLSARYSNLLKYLETRYW